MLGGPELYTRAPGSQTVTSRPTDNVITPRNLTGVAVNPNGDIVVADQGVRKLLRITPSGVVVIAAGSGSGIALNTSPSRIAVDANNNIYIAGTDRRVTRLSADRAFLRVDRR